MAHVRKKTPEFQNSLKDYFAEAASAAAKKIQEEMKKYLDKIPL